MEAMIRSIVTVAALALISHAGIATAHCENAGKSTSQLRLVDLHNWEPSMQSTIATEGFPAIAESSAQIAILKTLDAAENSSVLDVVAIDTRDLLKRFVLFPEHGGGNPHSESSRQRLATTVVEPNEYLDKGKFKPMQVLFDESEIRVDRYAPFWETVSHGLLIRYERSGSILQITSIDDRSQEIRLEWPARVLDPAGPDGMIQCGIKGVPMKGWTDPTVTVIVLRVLHAGGPAHGCDEPEEWRIERLSK